MARSHDQTSLTDSIQAYDAVEVRRSVFLGGGGDGKTATVMRVPLQVKKEWRDERSEADESEVHETDIVRSESGHANVDALKV